MAEGKIIFNYWYPKDIPKVREELDKITGVDKLIFEYMDYSRPQEELKKFIDAHRGEYDWLFLASTDVIVKQENIDAMKRNIEKYDYKVMSGVMNGDMDKLSDIWNIVYKIDDTVNYDYVKAHSVSGMVRVEHQGWALMAIHSSLFESYPNWYIPKWRNPANDRRLSIWLKENNIPVYADCDNEMYHMRFAGEFDWSKKENIIFEKEIGI